MRVRERMKEWRRRKERLKVSDWLRDIGKYCMILSLNWTELNRIKHLSDLLLFRISIRNISQDRGRGRSGRRCVWEEKKETDCKSMTDTFLPIYFLSISISIFNFIFCNLCYQPKFINFSCIFSIIFSFLT